MKYFQTKYAMTTFITFDNSLGDLYVWSENKSIYVFIALWWQPCTLFYILEYLSCLSIPHIFLITQNT
jgi:hypothetical protein